MKLMEMVNMCVCVLQENMKNKQTGHVKACNSIKYWRE